MRRIILAAVMLGTPLAAQTVQQRFDSARAKIEASEFESALTELQALEAYLKNHPKPNPTNLAVTRAQLAEVLIKLGRGAEAEAAVRLALSDGALDRPALIVVRDNARLTLAGLLEHKLDHRAAAAEFLRAADTSDRADTRTVAFLGAARTRMFTEPAAALTHVDQALALAEADATVGKKELANVLGLKGRILLNAGRDADAKALLVRAVNARGGLALRVAPADVSLRADAAIAFLRLKQDEEARRYLAYTGAGRTDVQLQPPVDMPLPACGEEGLEPQDSAVIEFTILSEGRVGSPRPIYASRAGEAAYVFARAVERWSWDPENASKVQPFFRSAVRVELRCTGAIKRPPLTAEFIDAAQQWFAAKAVRVPELPSQAAQAAELQRRLSVAPNGSAERLAYLTMLARAWILDGEERLRLGSEAMQLADRLSAPGALRFIIALNRASVWADENSQSWRDHASKKLMKLAELRARPDFVDPAMQAVLDLEIAQAAGTLKQADQEMAALKRVTDSPALPARHPLKVGALVQLANAHAARKEMDAAQSVYALTGLTAQQCALVDGGPVMVKTGTGHFPLAALNWGFEGWTSLEYDVGADGNTRNSRAVAAFPPRVFAEASEELARTVKYRVSYRPEGDLACTAMSRRVRFSIPKS